MSAQPKMKVHPNGTKEWRLRGRLHRTDGPAYEWADGSKAWFLNGNRHRTDGPAWEWADGPKEWWLNGKAISWQELFRQANDPEIELRILIAALTTT
jgi:hypothetical protein